MIERTIAETQAKLSYLIVAGYFGLKILEGLHWLTPVSSDLKEVLMLVGAFWFMRQREKEVRP